MREIIRALNGFKGETVDIYTDHKLFGKQHIVMDFDPETDAGLGFRCKGQAIYVDNGDIDSCCADSKVIVIVGSVMSIVVVKRD